MTQAHSKSTALIPFGDQDNKNMKPISKLQMAAVRGRWASLEWLYELHDENGQLIREPTLEQLRRLLGFGAAEARRHLRLRASVAVLKAFRPPVIQNMASWAQQARALRAMRLERLDDELETQREQHEDALLEAYQLEQAGA